MPVNNAVPVSALFDKEINTPEQRMMNKLSKQVSNQKWKHISMRKRLQLIIHKQNDFQVQFRNQPFPPCVTQASISLEPCVTP